MDVEDPWVSFATDLEEALKRIPVGGSLMIRSEGSDTDKLLFETDDDAGLRLSSPSDRFLGAAERLGEDGDEQMRLLGWLPPVESASQGPRSPVHHYREWPHPIAYGEAVALGLATLQMVWRITHPSQLRYEAFHPGGSFAIPILEIAYDRRTELGPSQETTSEELEQFLEVYLSEMTGQDSVAQDANGYFMWTVDGSAMFAGVRDGDPPVAWMAIPLAWGFDPTPEVLNALNELNDRTPVGQVYLKDGRVDLYQEMPSYVVSMQVIAWIFDTMTQFAREFPRFDRVALGALFLGADEDEARDDAGPRPTGYL